VKWPNDLLLAGRKLGGILCEGSWDGGRLEFVVVGIGLNLLQAEADFPEGIRDRAISLRAVAGPVSRFDVAGRIVDAVRSVAQDAGDPETADEWFRRVNSRDALLGRDVRVVEPESGSSIASGRAAGIQADGSLRLGTRTGTIDIRAGTIEFVSGTE
jgi:BirA family biotin operon repressor/biotin-[acetyl-CoA-carboxylase] ligase